MTSTDELTEHETIFGCLAFVKMCKSTLTIFVSQLRYIRWPPKIFSYDDLESIGLPAAESFYFKSQTKMNIGKEKLAKIFPLELKLFLNLIYYID